MAIDEEANKKGSLNYKIWDLILEKKLVLYPIWPYRRLRYATETLSKFIPLEKK